MTGASSRSPTRFAKRYFVAAAGAAYAFTLGLGSRRHRGLIRRIASHFGHRDGVVPQLPVVAINSLTSASTAVALPEPLGTDGNVSLLELLVLARLVRERRPARIFEIGTFDGRTTLALAMNSLNDAIVYTLDLPAHAPTRLALEPAERVFIDKPTPGLRFSGTDAAKKIRQLSGDSATFDFSPYAANLVFVDASHAYEYVLNDSERALGILGETGGMIVWHDYGEWDGVTRALDTLAATDNRFAELRWVDGTTLAVLDLPPSRP